MAEREEGAVAPNQRQGQNQQQQQNQDPVGQQQQHLHINCLNLSQNSQGNQKKMQSKTYYAPMTG